MTSFYEFLEQRDPNFLTEMDRRGFLGAIGAAGAAAFLGGNAQAQTNKMTPEELYELVKPPVANFTSFVKPKKNEYEPNQRSPGGGPILMSAVDTSVVYKMNNLTPLTDIAIKEKFISIANKPNEEDLSKTIQSCFSEDPDIKQKAIMNLKHMFKVDKAKFMYFLSGEVWPQSGINHKYGIYLLGRNLTFKPKGNEDVNKIINLIGDNDGSKMELYDNIIRIMEKYEKLRL